MRDVNKSLQFEVDDLKQKLKDSYGDIKVCLSDSHKFFHGEVNFICCIILPHADFGEYCALDLFVDFSTAYIVCLFTSYASPLVLFASLFLYLSFHLRIDTLHFQATKIGLFKSF